MNKYFLFCLAFVSMYAHAQNNALHNNSKRSTENDTRRFELVTNYYQNETWKARTISTCELTKVIDSTNILFEKITWIAQIVITGKDTLNETAEALRVKPYLISLDPGGTLKMPPIEIAAMTGAITDLNTFFVALHPKAGINKLHKKGDTFILPEPVKGDFANGKDILKGEDCINISNRLITNNKEKVIETSFFPPANPCLDYYLPEFKTPVSGDTINNFQMVRPAGNNKYNILYGKETFIITSQIKRGNGELSKAIMKNDLQLKLKINCDDAYGNCQTNLPWHIYREVQLNRLN